MWEVCGGFRVQEQIATQRIDEFATAHRGFVCALALKLAPVRGAAEDIAQEVFLEFVAKAQKWDLSEDARPLLAAMTRNVAKRYWRTRARELSPATRELAKRLRSGAAQIEIEWYGAEEKQALRSCLEELPERSRRMIHAYYFLGMTAAEIGLRLKMRAVAVRNALFRLRARLRGCIGAGVGGSRDD